MADRSLFRFVFFGLLLSGLCFSSNGFAGDLLIFSPTHAISSTTKKPTGRMELIVTSFDPIKSVSLNGKALTLTDDYSVEVSAPLSLSKGDNSYTLEVVTATESKKVTYNITLEDKESGPKVKDALTVLTMAGLHMLDNATNATSTGVKEGATKWQFLVKPTYKLSKTDSVYGMMLREKYGKASLAGREIVMTQLGGTTKLMGFPLDVGVSDIGTKMSGFSAKTKVETDLYLKSSQKFGSVNVSGDFTYRNMDAKPANAQQDGDGLRMLFKGDYGMKLLGLNSTAFGSFENMDAKGKYKDRYALRAGLKAKDKMAGINVNGSLDLKNTQYMAIDETSKTKEATSLTTLNLGGAYPLDSVAKGMLLLGTFKYSTQSSNVSSKKYSGTDLGVAMIYNF